MFTPEQISSLIGLVEDALTENKPDGNFRDLTDTQRNFRDMLKQLVNMQMADYVPEDDVR